MPHRFALCVAVFVAAAGALPGHAAGPFDSKLSTDKQIVHVLNRLTFGARPGDHDAIRKIGVEKWIRLQLQPGELPENPALLDKLKPLDSQRLATWQIYETYQQTPVLVTPRPSPAQLLPGDQLRQLTTATRPAAERRAILDALAPDARRQLLAYFAPAMFEGLPDIQAEAAKASQAEQAIRQAEVRKLRPPLNELLTPDQVRGVQRGTDEEKMAILRSLDPEKRALVLRTLQPNAVPVAFRREAMRARAPQELVMAELIEAKLYRALHSNQQLREVLVDFWLNHFNVFSGKGSVRMLLTSYERDAIRPHVFGRFRDMLLATARHPAMLFYLDNHLSRAPDEGPAARVNLTVAPARRPGLNENYARELMELHTLGVDGGYTQADVVNVARAFTGWTIHEPNRYGEFFFNPAMHDRNEKVVLGHTLPRGGGEDDGVKVIDILVRHPSTARFLSRKLAQRFVADTPPQSLVDRMAETFLRTDGDLRAVTTTMLTSKEFLSEGAWQAKLKSPLEMVLSSLRALDAEVTDTTAIAQRIAELGQPLYGKSEPTGYANTSEVWRGSAGLLGRINFATALTSGQIPGVRVDLARLSGKPSDAVREFMGTAPSADTLAAIESEFGGGAAGPAALATVLVASPEFQKR